MELILHNLTTLRRKFCVWKNFVISDSETSLRGTNSVQSGNAALKVPWVEHILNNLATMRRKSFVWKIYYNIWETCSEYSLCGTNSVQFENLAQKRHFGLHPICILDSLTLRKKIVHGLILFNKCENIAYLHLMYKIMII